MTDSPPATPSRSTWADWYLPAAVLAAIAVSHFFASPVAEPFKNGDETRHVMTGVFFRDALMDFPESASDPKGYAVRYYAQYPALGLVVWPPFFHAVEGLAMAIFGTSYLTARLVLAAFTLLGGIYAYRIALRTHGREVALISLAILGLAPVVFDTAGYVLLEVPAVAMVLAAMFHFERYLGELRGRDAVLACLFAAFAALTRFDGIMLLPLFLIRLSLDLRFGVLLRRWVLIGIAMALVLTVPYYLFTWQVYRTGIETAAVSGTNKEATSFLDAKNFYLYPSYVPEQIGWPATVAVVLGIGVSIWFRRSGTRPHVALIAATYIMFVPFAEPNARHAIYWVPALAVFAAVGIVEVARLCGRRWGMLPVAALVVYTGGIGVTDAGWYVRGNKAAAEYVVANSSGERPVLVDGDLNGAFIFYVRRADPDRKLWVLRGDKALYAVMSDPHGKYEEYAKTDAEVLAVLHKYDPEYIVVEQPQLLFDLPAASRLREVLKNNPDRFEFERVVHYDSNHHIYRHGRLEIYRKLDRNPEATKLIELPVLGLGRSVGATR